MNEEAKTSPTKALFDSLRQLYRQSSQLLLDCDRLMGERSWESASNTTNMTTDISGLSTLTNKWFPRYAFRYYIPSEQEGESEDLINSLKFVSTHFTSGGHIQINEPLLVAGNIKYCTPFKRKQVLANTNTNYKIYAYWFCRSWFWGKSGKSYEVWYTHKPEKHYVNTVEISASFALPLYEITSSQILEQSVIKRLFEDIPVDFQQ